MPYRIEIIGSADIEKANKMNNQRQKQDQVIIDDTKDRDVMAGWDFYRHPTIQDDTKSSHLTGNLCLNYHTFLM